MQVQNIKIYYERDFRKCVVFEPGGCIPSLELKQPAINGNPGVSDLENWSLGNFMVQIMFLSLILSY